MGGAVGGGQESRWRGVQRGQRLAGSHTAPVGGALGGLGLKGGLARWGQAEGER